MALPRESAFLPTIKCSTCGREIEISMMGDHVCSEADAESEPSPRILARPRYPFTHAISSSTASAPTAFKQTGELVLGQVLQNAPEPRHPCRKYVSVTRTFIVQFRTDSGTRWRLLQAGPVDPSQRLEWISKPVS